MKWIVVDDGSTDNTEEVVKPFIEERKIDIRLIKKNNGGKHTALNQGIKIIDTELTIIVDSDDILMPDAINVIEKYYEKYKDNHKIGIWSFQRAHLDGRLFLSLNSQEIVDNYNNFRIKGNRPGDMAEVFRSSVLKEFPFPEFEGERFLAEDIVWIEVGKKYDSVFINKPIYQAEYLEDGLTANDKHMKFLSPFGSMLRGKRLMSPECGLLANIKGAIIYNCYRNEAPVGVVPVCLEVSRREKILLFLTWHLGKAFYFKWHK